MKVSLKALALALLGLWLVFGGGLSPHTISEAHWTRMFATIDVDHAHWLGTDAIGRDVYVRLLYAARVSVALGLGGALVALALGLIVGLFAAERGGLIDQLLMRAVDILSALPLLFLLLLLMALFGRSLALIVLAAGSVLWLDFARIVRSETLRLKRQPFIEAAQLLGFSRAQIRLNELLPNLQRVASGYLVVLVPKMILLESFLSFLGLGVQEPYASLGGLIADGAIDMERRPLLLLAPVLALAALLLAVRALAPKATRE
jgi:oligopeptide transport system permease protein